MTANCPVLVILNAVGMLKVLNCRKGLWHPFYHVYIMSRSEQNDFSSFLRCWILIFFD